MALTAVLRAGLTWLQHVYLTRLELRLAFFFFQAEVGIRDGRVTGVQTCALPICASDGATGPPRASTRAPPRSVGCRAVRSGCAAMRPTPCAPEGCARAGRRAVAGACRPRSGVAAQAPEGDSADQAGQSPVEQSADERQRIVPGHRSLRLATERPPEPRQPRDPGLPGGAHVEPRLAQRTPARAATVCGRGSPTRSAYTSAGRFTPARAP